jgi:hypothetical protein
MQTTKYSLDIAMQVYTMQAPNGVSSHPTRNISST